MSTVTPLPPSRAWLLSDVRSSRGRARRVAGLSKARAEDLLDWLEANGLHGRLLYADERGFTVEYERPAG